MRMARRFHLFEYIMVINLWHLTNVTTDTVTYFVFKKKLKASHSNIKYMYMYVRVCKQFVYHAFEMYRPTFVKHFVSTF